MKLTPDVAEALKHYVYVYVDPRNSEVFYIGKGKEDRLFAHLDDTSESTKVARIAEIRRCGFEPQIDVLRYGLNESEAQLVEAAAIDLIGKAHLTNQVAGHHRYSFGRITSQEVIVLLAATPVEVRHKALLITINQLYRSDMTPIELYEATRGVWKLGPRREQAELALAVYQGVVREVYRIGRWHAAGTLPYETRDAIGFRERGRWEFEGEVADNVREAYVGRSVGKGGQNPVRYVNI